MAGHDPVTSVEPDRWAQDSLLDPKKDELGYTSTGVRRGFFGIFPREASKWTHSRGYCSKYPLAIGPKVEVTVPAT